MLQNRMLQLWIYLFLIAFLTQHFGALPEQNFTVAIRVLMKRDGTILNATVVDAARAKSDAVYNSVARSARNAVLLSSPIALPPGRYGDTMDMILNMNPRDTLR